MGGNRFADGFGVASRSSGAGSGSFLARWQGHRARARQGTNGSLVLSWVWVWFVREGGERLRRCAASKASSPESKLSTTRQWERCGGRLNYFPPTRGREGGSRFHEHSELKCRPRKGIENCRAERHQRRPFGMQPR